MKLWRLGLLFVLGCVDVPHVAEAEDTAADQSAVDMAAIDISTPDLLLEDQDLGDLEGDSGGQALQDMASAEPTTIEESAVRPAMIPIPSGTFLMGSPDSEPYRTNAEVLHTVEITKSFFIGQTEVTTSQWQELMGTPPGNDVENSPVGKVNWYDGVAYMNALSRQEGLQECYQVTCEGAPGDGVSFTCSTVNFVGLNCKGYRFPTDAEWEYSARAGARDALYGELSDIAWWNENAEGPQPVGEKKANAWNLHDMIGNVSEWTNDPFIAPLEDAVDPLGWRWAVDANRVIRGCNYRNVEIYCRLARRDPRDPRERSPRIGLRPARTILGR